MESNHNKGFSTQGIDPPRATLNERSWNRTAQISEARSASPALPTDFSTNEGADRSPHAGRREEGISVLVPPERFRDSFSRSALHATRICSKSAEKRHRRSEEHTSELQSLTNLVCRLLLEKKKNH